MSYVYKRDRMEGGILRWETFVRSSSVALGPSLSRSCPAIVPQFFTTWALQSQYATHAHAFLLSFFVTVENKRLVNPTPKRKVARWNRAGGTTSSCGKRLRDRGRLPFTKKALWLAARHPRDIVRDVPRPQRVFDLIVAKFAAVHQTRHR